MSKYERINIAIPVNSDWSIKDLEEKAESVGLGKSAFCMMGINILMDFSDEQLKTYVKGVLEIEEEVRQIKKDKLKKLTGI